MPRTSKVTFAASAVTLTCLAGALYISPVVVAETMGRDVTIHSLMSSDSPTKDHAENTVEAHGGNTDRAESVQSKDDSRENVDPEQGSTPDLQTSEDVDIAGTSPDDDDNDSTPAPSESETARIISEIPVPNASDEESSEDDASSPTADASEPSEAPEDGMPDDVDSPDSITVIVNKLRSLPADFVPEDLVELPTQITGDSEKLREEAADAVETMFAAAEDDSIELEVVSSYRSYEYQQRLFDNYQEQYGNEGTDRMSARPGHSEHQTGLAFDVDTPQGDHTLQTSFGETEAGQWLADHGHEYGFVIRYPEDQQNITGFHYEPWHLRYFGEQYATEIFENSGVAEKEFGLDDAPDYED